MDETRTINDEKAVQSVIETVQSMINPFDYDGDSLVNISNGVVASDVVAHDMKQMRFKGEDAALSFIKERIVVEKPDIHSKIKRTDLKTFSSMSKKTKAKDSKGKLTELNNSKNLFAKMIMVAKSRDLDLKEVFKYSLRPIPLSIASFDGGLMKTVKAKLMHAVEEEVSDLYVDRCEGNSAVLIDGMAFLQTISSIPLTFGELSTLILTQIIKIAVSLRCSRVDFVCDRYPDTSIKNLEREKRAADGAQVFKIYNDQQKVPKQWKKFLSAGENKEEIQKYLFNTWKDKSPYILRGIEVFVTHQNECHKLSASEEKIVCTEVERLMCDHEEADTRLILHASNAAQTHSNVIIRSPDTDVFFVALNASLVIHCEIFFLTGTQNKTRIISLGRLKHELGSTFCAGLLGLHAVTGSSFFSFVQLSHSEKCSRNFTIPIIHCYCMFIVLFKKKYCCLSFRLRHNKFVLRQR